MLVRTVVTKSTVPNPVVQQNMLKLGLAQNVETTPTYHVVGDWVDPELLGLNHKTYLFRVRTMQDSIGCVAHVEVL